MVDSQDIPDDGMKVALIGHLLIRDVETGEVLFNQRDVSVSHNKKGPSNVDD
jgi:hypothetical protein